MSTFAQRTAAFALLLIATALCLLAWQHARRDRLPDSGTAYQAVALMNGQLFYGQLETEGDYLVLRKVFYVQTRQNPATGAVANVLVRRGGEAHQPDRMIVNRRQVLLVEPVKSDSQIGRLIAEQK